MVAFKTVNGAYTDVTMTVTGPEAFRLEQRFSGNERPRLSVRSPQGLPLPDGSYTVDLTARPARSTGTPAVLVYSTTLAVVQGRFAGPEDAEASPAPGDDLTRGSQRPDAPSIDTVQARLKALEETLQTDQE
ncbi:hypothetical protein MJD09_15275 [bacterium]|nr:hypothetical protein [bacterium]